MSTLYYILKKSTNEYVFLGTGSYYNCHEDLTDILQASKENNMSLESVQRDTMRIYDDYSCDLPLSDEMLQNSWYYKKFIPAIYNWYDDSCVLAEDYELNNYAKSYLIQQGKLNPEDVKDENIITMKDYVGEVLKEVGSIREDENKNDSIIDMGLSFSLALNELKNGKTIYRKSVLPEVDYKYEDNKLYWNYIDDTEKHYLNVIGIDLLFAQDWLIKD